MPNGWVHAVIDLIAYGRPYFNLHKEKDKASEVLGPNHRIVNHEWYQSYGKLWSFRDPFPFSLKKGIITLGNREGVDKAEEQMASVDHDYVDRIWDTLSPPQRKNIEGFCAWILFNPETLKEWAGVDVINGRIQRRIDGHEVWEDCAELRSEYVRLCNYVKVVKEKDKILRNMIDHYYKNKI